MPPDDEGKSGDMRGATAVRPLPIEELPEPPQDAIKRAAIAFRRERILISIIASLITFVILAGLITIPVALARQSEVKRNTELSVCIAALEARLHLGEIAMLRVDPGPERNDIADALHLDKLALHLERLNRYCA